MEGLAQYEKEERPWGGFERFTLNEKTTVKIHTVAPDQSLSLQTHEHRDEFWRVLRGSGTFQIGDNGIEAREGDSHFCPRGTPHRLSAGAGGMTVLEIAFGDFEEGDITRLEDRYGRS